jgi:DNA-binding PadR family transcriptional regulator
MSIDKIIERIKMIENNDFSLSNDIINEDISLNPDDFNTFFGKSDYKTVDNISKLDASLSNADSLHNKWMNKGGNMDVNINFSDKLTIDSSRGAEDLPKKDHSVIYKIYTAIKNKGLLTKDLDQSTFKPKKGYFRTKKGNELVLLDDKKIIVEFNNDKLTKLTSLILSRDKKNVTIANFTDLFNEFDNNKSKYNINSISLVNGGNDIVIKF